MRECWAIVDALLSARSGSSRRNAKTCRAAVAPLSDDVRIDLRARSRLGRSKTVSELFAACSKIGPRGLRLGFEHW
jgi:hypothetical protein